MLITDYLMSNANKYPNTEALIHIDSENSRTELSWQDFDIISNQLANFLKSKNIKTGDKVGLLLQNEIIWLPIYFGILKSGATAVLLNYNSCQDEIEHCIILSDCKGLFFSHNHTHLNSFLNDNLWAVDCSDKKKLLDTLKVYSTSLVINNISSDGIASIYFSSGTTGHSKAILITHKALVSAAQMELSHHKQCFEDRFLCICPLYHAGAKIHWLGSLVVGGAIVLYNCPLTPKNLLSVIEKERITITFLLVPQIQDIIDALDLGDISLNNYNLEQWRLMHSGAQYIPQPLIERWLKYFTNQKYDTNYGLTESTGPGCIHLGVDNTHKLGSIGKADPNWEVDIVKDGTSVSCGKIGELIVKGPGIMVGYYKDHASTDKVLINGWLYTGDMAYMDEDGFIYIVGRKKDIIISGGENIYPAQIERFLRKLPGVKDVAVIGFPNSRMGELIAAVLELDKGIQYTKKELISYCNSLPVYQRPYKFIFDKLIRNHMGKVDKAEMRRRYL